MTATARRRSGSRASVSRTRAVVGAVDARLDEDGAADAVGVHQPGIVGERRRDRRVVALRRQRIARGRSEDVNVRVAGPFRQAEAGPRPRLGGAQAEGRDVGSLQPALSELADDGIRRRPEIAALVGLENALLEQPRIAARREAPVDGRSAGRAAAKLGFLDEDVEPPRRDIEPDHVAVAQEGERTADRRLGGDMDDDGAEGGAAHAGVGDPHHVLDAGRGELARDRQEARLGHAGRPFRAGVAEDEDVVGRDVEVGAVDARGEIFHRVRRRRRGRCGASAGRRRRRA